MFSCTFGPGVGFAARLAAIIILIAALAGFAQAQTLTATPSSLTAAAQQGSTTVQSLPVALASSTGTQVPFVAYFDSAYPSWLSLASPGSGLSPGTGLTGRDNLIVTVNPTGLTAGSYSSSSLKVYVQSAGQGTAITIPITLNIGGTGALSVSTNSLTFTATAGGSSPVAQTVQVSTASGSNIAATTAISYTVGSGWLSVTPAGGILSSGSPLTLNVSAATGSLTANPNYAGSITISSGGNTQVVNVTFNVQAGSTISASPNPAYMNAQTGGSYVTQDVTITNLTSSPLTAVTPSISAGAGWLSSTGAVAVAGSSSATITLTASPSAGTQTGQLTLTPSTGSAINVPVYLTVSATATLSLNKSAMVFNTTTGALSDSVILTNSSVNPIFYNATVTYNQAYTNWLSITPSAATVNPGSSSAQNVTVSANATGLPTNTYTATIYVTPTSGGGSAQTINVTFSVGGSVSISASPTSLTINAPANQTASASVQISSTNSSVTVAPTGGTNVFCTSPTYQYCGTINQASAVASPGFPATFTVASFAGLATGTYTATLTFTPSSGSAINVPLTINAGTGSGGGLTATPSALSFTGTPGSVVQSSQLYLSTGSTGYYSASSNQGWLSVGTQGSSFASVYAPGYLSVFANPLALSAGTYYGNISVTGTGGTLTVSVTFTVGGGGGGLTVTPATLSFSGAVGSGQTATQSVSVYGTTSTTYNVQATTQSGGSWLVLSQTFGQTGTSFTVLANASGLAAGTYYGSLSVTSSIGSQTITVTFVVGGGGGGSCGGSTGSIAASPTALQFAGATGGGPTAAQTVILSTSSGSADYTVSVSASWLAAQPEVGTVTSTASRSLQVQASPASLTDGTYNGSVTITGGGGQLCIPITFVVGGGGGGGTSGLTASPASLTLNSPLGSTALVSQYVALSGTGGLSFTAYATTTSGSGWLSVTPNTGTSPASLLVQANPISLGTGSQQGNIVVSTYLGTMNIPVVFNVGSSGGFGNLTVSPTAMTFSAQASGAAPAAQPLYVNSTTGFSTSFSATVSNATWLSVSPASSFTPASLNVMVNQAGLSAGTYYGTINILGADGFSQQAVQVTLTVSSANLVVTPALLTFTAPAGGSAPAQSLSVSSPLGSVTFTASASTTSGGSWLAVSPTSGATTGSVSATVNAAGLNPGTYNGTLTFISTGIGTVNVPVTLTVTQVVTMTVAPETLAFEAVAGATTAIPTKTISVNVSSGNVQYTAAAATSSGGNWIQVSPASGTTPGTLTVTANATGLNPGVFNGTVTVSVAGASNTPRVVQVTLTVTSPAPVVAGVANAAAGNAGILGAGTITSIYGQGLGPDTAVFPQLVSGGLVPTEVSTVRVLFDGIPGPILYAQARQVNTVIPWSLFGRTTVRVEVEYRGNRSAAVQIQLYDASPGIFSVDGSGVGQGAILNQDGTVNSTLNGAPIDSAVAIFATGMGQTEPLGVDGAIPTSVLPKPTLPVSVLLGNVEAVVEYAGAAPYLVSGAMQVNVRIPRGLQPGAYALTLRIGRFSSQLGITVVVK
jgi:uncharacterized protein (TIGR03437 family)